MAAVLLRLPPLSLALARAAWHVRTAAPLLQSRAHAVAMSTVQLPDVSGYATLPQPDGTEQVVMQQTMIRVKDPIRSLDFYCKVLGMKLIWCNDFPRWGFSVYFVAPRSAPVPEDNHERFQVCMTTPGCIELTWNHGSEAEAENNVYNTGNSDATGTKDGQTVRGGFGHLGVTVPDVYAACDRFKSLGVQFHKSPNSGGMKGLAFIRDPDGYLVEVLPQAYDPATGTMPTRPLDCMGVALDGGEGYKDNSKA